MPFSVRLEQDVVNRLRKYAVRQGRPMSDVVREAVEAYMAAPAPMEGEMTPYDRLAHLIGRVDTGVATRSVNTGRQFAARLRERRRARRDR